LGGIGKALSQMSRRWRGRPGADRIGQWHRTDLERDPAWADRHKVAWHYIAPDKPVQNAFIESFNGKRRSQ
jgi:putative transposase